MITNTEEVCLFVFEFDITEEMQHYLFSVIVMASGVIFKKWWWQWLVLSLL